MFSLVFTLEVAPDAIVRFVDALRLFPVGYSWGGVTSLAMPHFELKRRHRGYGPRLVRFNVGLEEVDDLVRDLEQGFQELRG